MSGNTSSQFLKPQFWTKTSPLFEQKAKKKNLETFIRGFPSLGQKKGKGSMNLWKERANGQGIIRLNFLNLSFGLKLAHFLSKNQKTKFSGKVYHGFPFPTSITGEMDRESLSKRANGQ